jgi:hypothetical protein
MHSDPTRGPAVRTRPDASAASAAEARLNRGAHMFYSDEHLDCFPVERYAKHDSECQTKVNTIFSHLMEWTSEEKNKRIRME